MSIHRTTKEQCHKYIGNFVCASCGGTLLPKETFDSRGTLTYWPYCNSCHHFDWGVSVEVYRIAKELVTRFNYISTPGIPGQFATGQAREQWVNSQIYGASVLVDQILKLHIKEELKGKKVAISSGVGVDALAS